MKQLIVECIGCGWTWYPEKKRWESNPDAPEPDCPNSDCKYYGNGFRAKGTPSIWKVKGAVKVK